jgi:polysaccharide export outer membrane protein
VAKLRAFETGLVILLLGAPMVLFGQSQQASSTAPKAMVARAPSQSDSDRPALAHRNPRYQVMRDDVLLLSFPLSPELNQTVTIQPDGYITLVGAGSLFVQGMTVPDLVEALKKAYAKILHEPIIDVDLKDFQKPFFVVSGQVGKPGQYDLRYDATVSQAIAIAGGLTPQAKTQIFVFHRRSAGWMEVQKLNLKDVMNGKNVNEDAEVRPGDMIFIPEKFITKFRKYVPYTFNAGVYFNPSNALF